MVAKRAELDKGELIEDDPIFNEEVVEEISTPANPPPPPRPKKAPIHPLIRRDLVLIACLALTGLLGGVAFGVVHSRLPASSAADETELTGTESDAPEYAGEAMADESLYPFEPFLFIYEDILLRVRIAVEIDSEKTRAELVRKAPQIRKGIYRVLLGSEPVDVVHGDRTLQSRLLETVNRNLVSPQALELRYGILHDED